MTSMDSCPSCWSIETWHWPVWAWRTTLVTASWMMRNADRSMSAGSGSRLPCHSTSTRTPASRVVAASRSRPARPGAGAGIEDPAPGARLDRDDADAVRHDVVHVAGDPQPLRHRGLRARLHAHQLGPGLYLPD